MSKAPAAGLNLGHVDSDPPVNVEENRKRFFARLGLDRFSLATLRQVHSAEIFHVKLSTSGSPEYIPSALPDRAAPRNRPQSGLAPGDLQVGDALVTVEPGILLSVRSADCVPILLVDLRRHAVAAIHAGWRGGLARIVEKTVGEMRRVFGSRPRDLAVAIGPSIRDCCYEVGEEVEDAFCGRFANSAKFFVKQPRENAGAAAERSSTSFLFTSPPSHQPFGGRGAHLDLVAVALDQLGRAGVLQKNVEVADFCTACRTDLFFSHRKEGNHTGRMMAVVGLRTV